MTGRRVVVTGIGTINPLGNNIEEYFSNLEKGVSGAAPITHFNAEKFKTRFACEVKNYDPSQHFDRKEVRKYDLFTQYALIAATQAVEDSGLDLEDRQGAGRRNLELGYRRTQIVLRRVSGLCRRGWNPAV